MRAVPEWIGATPDTRVPNRVRTRVFERFGGVCQCSPSCGVVIRPPMKWQIDHRVALINGGGHQESNMVPILEDHHKLKTAGDVAVKSKTYRMKARHLGLRKPSRFPGSRDSRWKKKVDGTVVPRALTAGKSDR